MKWNKTARAELHGVRRRDATDPPGAWEPIDAAKAWSELRDRPTWTLDAHFLRDEMEAVVAQCASPTPPAFEASRELCRAAWLLCGQEVSTDNASWEAQAAERALARLWLATGGVAATLRLLLSEASFATTVSSVRDASGAVTTKALIIRTPSHEDDSNNMWATARYRFRPPSSETYLWCGASAMALWVGVRCAMNTLADDAFRAASDEARAVRATLDADDHWGRAAIAFAFSRDPSHAAEELARIAARARCSNGHPSRVPAGAAMHLLVIAAPDLESARFLLPFCDVAEIAFDLVESFGGAVIPTIEDALGDALVSSQAAWIRKSKVKRFQGVFKVLELDASLEEIEAKARAKRAVPLPPKPEARKLDAERYAVKPAAGGLPPLSSVDAILPGTTYSDAYPWETDAALVEAESQSGEREFWLAKVKLAPLTPSAVRAWADAKGYRPATLREALAFQLAVPEALDAKGYIALGATNVHLPDLRCAPRFELHKAVGARMQTENVSTLKSVTEGDQCGVIGVDWRYRPIEPEVEVAFGAGPRFLFVKR